MLEQEGSKQSKLKSVVNVLTGFIIAVDPKPGTNQKHIKKAEKLHREQEANLQRTSRTNIWGD